MRAKSLFLGAPQHAEGLRLGISIIVGVEELIEAIGEAFKVVREVRNARARQGQHEVMGFDARAALRDCYRMLIFRHCREDGKALGCKDGQIPELKVA